MGELSVGRSDSREWSLTQHRKSHKAHRLSVTSNGSEHLCLWDRSAVLSVENIWLRLFTVAEPDGAVADSIWLIVFGTCDF